MSVLLRLRAALSQRPVECKHVRRLPAGPVLPRTPHGCEECQRDDEDSEHLRLCLDCGHVGCADGTRHDHALRHARASGHAVVRHYEVDEPAPAPTWCWCYECESVVAGP